MITALPPPSITSTPVNHGSQPTSTDFCNKIGQLLTRALQQNGHCYSITSLAVASSDCGTSRPSALAVLRLITSSNLVGA